MKNKSLLKKGIGILLLLIMSAGVLSGCGKTSSEEEGISVYIVGTIFDGIFDPVKVAMSY